MIKGLNSSTIRFLNSSEIKVTFSIRHKTSFFLRRTMPKDKTNSETLRNMRIKAKSTAQSKPFVPPGEIYLSVLGNGSTSSARALYMFTDHKRYLFNCGEGTQRLAHEYKMKLSKLEHIFITHNSWENMGGLLGLSLTVQDIGVPEIMLHGPPDVEKLYQIADPFMDTNDLKVVKTNTMDTKFADSCMEVHYISISNSARHIKETFESEHKSKKVCLESSPDYTVAYACKGYSKPGHLMLEKCVDQGVPPGPLLGKLKNGEDVTLPCGKIVYSKDVVSEDQPCPLFLVVECPSEGFLDNFVEEEKFQDYQSSTIKSDRASVVVHFTPPPILKHKKYQDWMQRFPSSTCHLVLNTENGTLNSVAIHRIQYKLNLIHPTIFSLLQEEKGPICADGNIIQAQTLDHYYLRPSKGFDRSSALEMDSKQFVDTAKHTSDFEDNLKQLHSTIHELPTSIHESDYPEVAFLGTGSSIPSKVRNVTCILVNTSKDHYVLLDCGEGSHSQLLRLFGRTATHTILKQLQCIFVSHMHADHHLGLIQIMKHRENHPDPLLIVGPHKLAQWLRDYTTTFTDVTCSYRFVECYSLNRQYSFPFNTDECSLKDVQMLTVPVHHCPDAHGLILEGRLSKWKLVYSGDTTPCEALVAAGKDCDILIHEATMEDDLASEAVLKRHSTTSEAIKIGEKMNAKYTILTHFSQRYAKIPVFSEHFCSRVGCAFDNMRVQHSELPILPLFIPVLKSLFADHVEELQMKTDKRQKRLKLCKALNGPTDKHMLIN